jgi:hypothetical protein
MTYQPLRFFFVHLQKTAGTALVQRLREGLGRPAVYPDRSDGDPVLSVISVDHLCERWPSRRNEVTVLTGHFPLCTRDLLDEPFRVFTVLRDPVERTLSYLRHRRAVVPAERTRSLEALYADPELFHSLVHNHMVKMLGLHRDEMTDGVLTRVSLDERHLQRARDALASIDAFGLQEQFESFCEDLATRFGLHLGPARFANRTASEPVSPDFRSQIAADNALDVELYHFASRLHADRRAASTRANEDRGGLDPCTPSGTASSNRS